MKKSRLLFFVLFNFFKREFRGAFADKNLEIAIKCLAEKPSFRLLDFQHKTWRTLFQFIKQTVNLPILEWDHNKKNDFLIFDELEAVYDRKRYLNFISGKDCEFDSIGRKELLNFKSFWDKVSFLFSTILLSPLLLLLSLNKKKIAGNFGLLLFQIIEISNFLIIVKKGYEKVHLFGMYENDMNLIGCLFLKKSIPFIKHPSPAPLMAHNKWIVTDELAIEIPYQREELQSLDYCYFNQLVEYRPENAHKYLNLYKPFKKPTSKSIGFYSHAGWLRSKNKRTTTVFAKPEYEDSLLNWFNSFFKEKKKINIKVFLHPREKNSEIIEETKKYYQEKLGKINFELILSDIPNHHTFAEVELAISYYSTILFERQVCGYRSLCYVAGLEGFPIPNTSLDNICFSDLDELDKLLESDLNGQE